VAAVPRDRDADELHPEMARTAAQVTATMLLKLFIVVLQWSGPALETGK
jgi:hypothetical protein